jgi:hypothetical protein
MVYQIDDGEKNLLVASLENDGWRSRVHILQHGNANTTSTLDRHNEEVCQAIGFAR